MRKHFHFNWDHFNVDYRAMLNHLIEIIPSIFLAFVLVSLFQSGWFTQFIYDLKEEYRILFLALTLFWLGFSKIVDFYLMLRRRKLR
jgi:ABC-type dipeptide/oligopeptide/nickel transport system permease subunit